jgi:PAS domain S-box-containing protein
MISPAFIRILHVDAEESQREFTKIFLEQDGVIQVTSAASGKEALQLLEKESYDCIVSEYKMPEMTGMQLAKKIKPLLSIPFILYTGRGSEEVAEAAFKVGIDDYVRKEVEPAHFQVLARRILQIVERAREEKSFKASEEKFRRFFMNQPVLCYMVSKEGNIVEVNETVTDALGYTREELIGKPVITTLYSPSSRGKAEQLFRRWVETGELRNEELNIVTKTGEERTVLLNVDAVRDASGGVIQSISVQVDITQRRQMEEELRESEERYRTLVENSPNAISVTIGDTIVYANKKRAILAGKKDPSELVGTSALSQVAEEDRGNIIEIMEARERGKKPPSLFEYRMLMADGSVREIICYNSEIKYQGTTAVQHVLHDVTDQLYYEKNLEALYGHASKLQLAGNAQQICELTLDAMEQALSFKKAAFLSVEKGILRAIGTRGAPILDIPLPLDGRGITVKAANTRRTVLVNDLRGDHDFVMGSTDSLSELATPVLIDGETVAVLNVESLDLNAFTIEDQRLLEALAQYVALALSRLRDTEALRASEERYRTFLESSRDAVFVFDDNVYIYVNRAAVDMLGYDSVEEIIGLSSYSLVAPESMEEVMRRTVARAMGKAVPGIYEIGRLRRDGGVVPCEENMTMIMYEGRPVFLSVARDVTGRKKIEEQLRETHGAPLRRSRRKVREQRSP